MTSPLFRFSLLSLALAAGFAHAENEAKESVTLDTVTVKGDRQGSKIRTNIVTLQQKDENTATDLRALLKDEPAIDFGGGNGSSQFLTLRGMGQNSVDIKVDNAYSDSQMLYHQGRFIIDPALVKIVSVQKGAGSASAGIGATNGAIITKTVDAEDLLKGLDKNWGVRLNSGYASNDGVSYGASVFGKAGNFDGLFSYSRNDEKDYKPGKGYTNSNGGKTVPFSALDKRSYLAKIGANFGDHRLVLSETKGANFNLDSRIGENTLIKYGVNYRHQEIKPPVFFNPALSNPKKSDAGIYAEAIHDIGDFTLTGGLRYDHFNIKTHDGKSVSDGTVNPSFGVIWQPHEHWNLSASHNYASRSPRLYDAMRQHGRRNAITSIADGTKAERARNTEIGFNYNNGSFAANGSYFWQKIKDAVAGPQQRHDAAGNPIAGVREIVNAGYIKNHGYELGASYRTGGLLAKVGVSHSKPRIYDTHPENLLSANPEFAVQTGRTWTTSLSYRFQNPNLEIGWRGRYLQKASGSVLVRDKGEVKRKGYGVNDIFANWKPLGKDTLNVNFAVNNVFNKFYYPHSQRGETLPGIGRDVRLSVNYRF